MNSVRKAQQVLMQILFSVWKRKMVLLFVGLLSTLLLVVSHFGSNHVSNYGHNHDSNLKNDLFDQNFDRRPSAVGAGFPSKLSSKRQELSHPVVASRVLVKEVGADPDMETDTNNSNNSPAGAEVKNDVKAQENSNIAAPDTDNELVKKTNFYIPSLRVVHLDLKGAPPKIEYLKEFFDLIHKAGANGILLEYEGKGSIVFFPNELY